MTRLVIAAIGLILFLGWYVHIELDAREAKDRKLNECLAQSVTGEEALECRKEWERTKTW